MWGKSLIHKYDYVVPHLVEFDENRLQVKQNQLIFFQPESIILPVDAYISEYNHDTKQYEIVKEIRTYAKENNVPIMLDDGIEFLTKYIVENKINTVLEIGTAIGYSAIMMALANHNLTVTTIERDEKRYLEALKNIKKLKCL